MGFTLPSRVATDAVRSYRTLSPLPALVLRRAAGGLLSVALSVGSRPPGITWHLALCSPDFPRWSLLGDPRDRLTDAGSAGLMDSSGFGSISGT